MGDTAPVDASSQHAGLLSKVMTLVRRRPYLLLSILVLTPPFWTLVFFLMPVIVAGVVLVAGFVFVDQASQKQATKEEGIKTSDANGGPQESTLANGPASKDSDTSRPVPEVARFDQSADASLTSAAADQKPAHATTTSPSSVKSAGESKQSIPPVPDQKPAADPINQGLPAAGPKAIEVQNPSVPAPMTGPAMLARAAALRKSKLEAASRSSGETLFLYGSQTGNAMEVAKSLNAEAATHGIASRVLALDEKPLHKIPGTTKAAVFVVSSTGDGDPPENCERFHNALKRRTHAADLLAGVQFTVLGLGDSNYTTYMGVPRVFTSRLPELGAKRFYKNCEADEVDGLEDVIDKWKEGLWDALKAAVSEGANPPSVAPLPNGTANPPPASKESKLVGVPPLQKSRIKLIWQGAETIRTHGKLSSATNGTVTSLENGNPTIEYSAAHPFSAEVTAAEYMTASWSDRRVIHLEVDIARTGASYKPGDSLGVLPENRPELVDGLLERLGADGGRVFSVAAVDDVGTGQGDGSADVAGGARLLGHVGWPCTLREALLRHCDVTAVARKGLLRVLAEYCADSAERTELLMLSSRGGRDAYKVQIQEVRPSLLEILKRFPSCKPDLAHLLDSLPPLVARMYSVTCNANDAPGRVQVAFSVVKEQTGDGRVFHGVCTSWLERRLGLDPKTQRQFVANPSARVSVPVFLKSGGDFRLPEGLTAPLLMIGPGTGVAPFRGFLQQRRERLQAGGEAGPAWLFFGCRKEDEDFLYEKDLRKFETDGTLTKLVTAFSRAGDAKVYVQHKLSEHAEKLASLIQHGKAHVFICGDGVNMARDVHAALVKVLVDGAQMAEGDATALLNNMVKEKRYVRDIWS